jgi:hypothetical protein
MQNPEASLEAMFRFGAVLSLWNGEELGEEQGVRSLEAVRGAESTYGRSSILVLGVDRVVEAADI